MENLTLAIRKINVHVVMRLLCCHVNVPNLISLLLWRYISLPNEIITLPL